MSKFVTCVGSRTGLRSAVFIRLDAHTKQPTVLGTGQLYIPPWVQTTRSGAFCVTLRLSTCSYPGQVHTPIDLRRSCSPHQPHPTTATAYATPCAPSLEKSGSRTIRSREFSGCPTSAGFWCRVPDPRPGTRHQKPALARRLVGSSPRRRRLGRSTERQEGPLSVCDDRAHELECNQNHRQ